MATWGPHGGEISTWKGVDVVEMSKGWVKIGESGWKKGVPNLGMLGGGGSG